MLATDQLLYLSILSTHIVNSEVEVRANRSSGLHVDGVQYLTNISEQRASSRRRTSNSSRPSGAPMARTYYSYSHKYISSVYYFRAAHLPQLQRNLNRGPRGRRRRCPSHTVHLRACPPARRHGEKHVKLATTSAGSPWLQGSREALPKSQPMHAKRASDALECASSR